MPAFVPCSFVQYFDYPLEQGLRRPYFRVVIAFHPYFDYPLEQGLRHLISGMSGHYHVYFDYPLEQGLRRLTIKSELRLVRVF